jgi:hypothetical protein
MSVCRLRHLSSSQEEANRAPDGSHVDPLLRRRLNSFPLFSPIVMPWSECSRLAASWPVVPPLAYPASASLMSLPVANRGLFCRMSLAFTGIFTFLVSVTYLP